MAGPVWAREAARRRATRRFRRALFEQLEQRLTLDGELTNAALPAVQRQALVNGLQQVAIWSDTLSGFNRLAQPVSLIDSSIGQRLGMRSILENQLVAKLSATPTTTTDTLVAALKGLSTTVGDLTVAVNPASVTGGLLSSPQGDELQFTLTLDASRTSSASPNLGANALLAGLKLDSAASVPVSASLHFSFTFGFDLTPGLAAGEAFFVRVSSLTESAAVDVPSFSTPAKVGLLDVQVVGGSIDLDAATSVSLFNPDADVKGNITLTELQSTNISGLVNVSTTANSLTVNLPLTATLGSQTFGGSPNLSVAASNVFAAAAPTVTTNAGYDELAYFKNLLPENLLTVFDRVASGLTDVGAHLDVNAAAGGIPYVAAQVSDVVDFTALVGRVSRGLYDPVLTAQDIMALAPGDRLTGSASFSLLINDTDTVAVHVSASSQQVGEPIVAYLNRSLPPTLQNRVAFSRSGSLSLGFTLSLKAIDPTITKLEILISNRSDPITFDLGFEPSQTTKPVFKFTSVQTLIPLLAQLMGLTPAQVNPQFDTLTHALSFQINLAGTPFTQSVPLDFSRGLGPLTFLPERNATFTATPTVGGRVGVELVGLETILTGYADAPANGQLGSNAHFTLTLNSGTPITIAVAADATNNSVADLATDINAALAFVGLSGQVTATNAANRLSLLAPSGSTLQVTASPADSANTQLHLVGFGLGPKWSEQVFLDAGMQLSATAQITNSTLSGPAALGILPVTISGGMLAIGLTSGLALTAQTKVGDLDSAAVPLNVQAPTATLSGHFNVPVDASYGVNPNTPAAFDLALAAPNKLATVVVGTAAAPANGRLTTAANFALAVGGATPVAVTVPVDNSNQTVDDLVADINSALAAVGLRAQVTAGKSGAAITLIAPAPYESDTLHYTITVSHVSGPAVTGVRIADLLPAGLTFVTAAPTAGTYDIVSGLWSIPSIAAAGSETLVVTATVQLNSAPQTLINTASLVYVDQGDVSAANDSVSVQIQTQQAADLALTMFTASSLIEGQFFSYSLTLLNSGPGTATGIQVTDLLPAGITFSTANITSGGGTYDPLTGIWAVGSLAKNTSVTLTLNVRCVGAAGQTLINTATVTAQTQTDPRLTNNSVSRSLLVASAPLSASGVGITAVAGIEFEKVVATFTDPDPNGTPSFYTATIDWGDGTPTSSGTITANAQGGFSVTGTHTYQAAGFFGLTIQISDTGGSSTQTSSFANVAAATDTDGDGVPDAFEDSAPNSGDGNSDFTFDRLQNTVASLPNFATSTYVTLTTSPALPLTSVTARGNPSPTSSPAGASFPLGFFEFSAPGLASAAATTVTLLLHTPADVNGYYLFGKTPGNATDHWYEFLFDGTTGAEFVRNGSGLATRVVLRFQEGARGDANLSAAGLAVSPGAPAKVAATVNQPPSFELTASSVVSNDEAVENLPAFAVNILPGPPSESLQTLHFEVTNDNNDLFSVQPTIDPSGRLTFRPAPNVRGTAQITVVLVDSGGSANGGIDTSEEQTFDIVVTKAHVWHNVVNPLDVTGPLDVPDGAVAPGDVLEVINYINGFGSGPVPTDGRTTGPYLDVNADGSVAPSDALDIINHINGLGSGEGESPTGEIAPSLAAPTNTAHSSNHTSFDELLDLLSLDQASQPKRRK